MKTQLQGLLLLCACAAYEQPTYITQCGMEVVTKLPDGWLAEDLQAIEDLSLVHFTRVEDARFEDTCATLRYTKLQFVAGDTFMSPYHDNVSVYGETHCLDSRILLSSRAPHLSSLSHEIAHMVQTCQPHDCVHEYGDDPDHLCWTDSGIFKTIQDIKDATP